MQEMKIVLPKLLGKLYTFTHIYIHLHVRNQRIFDFLEEWKEAAKEPRKTMQFFNLLTFCSVVAATKSTKAPSQSSFFLEHSWDQPASLQPTTDGEGERVTKTLWWIPSSSSDPSHSKTPIRSTTGSDITDTTNNSENSLATILTSSNPQGEYTSTIWWLPSTSSQQGFTFKTPRTSIVSEKKGKTSMSTMLNSLPSSSFLSSSLGNPLTSTSITNKETKKDNSTIPVHSNAGGKIVDMSYGIGAIALALVLI